MNLVNKLKLVQIDNVLTTKKNISSLICVSSSDPIGLVVKLFETYGISQIPVIEADEIIGNVDDRLLLSAINRNIDVNICTVKRIMGKPMPVLEHTATAYEAYNYFLENKKGIIISYDGKPKNILTRIDILNFLIENCGDFEYMTMDFNYQI